MDRYVLVNLSVSIAASNIPERHVVVGGLISNSGYQFRVSISDNGYSDIGAVVLQTKTYIPRAAFLDNMYTLLC